MVTGLLLKLMFRELKKSWFEYLSMFVITVLAVTLFLGFLSNSLTLKKRSELYLDEAQIADLVVQTTTLSGFDRVFLSEKGEVEYRIYSDGSYKKEGKNPEVAEIYISDGKLNHPYLVSGEAGVLVDARVAANEGYQIGDSITVELTSFKEGLSALGMQASFELKITGLMHSIERVNIYSTSPVFLTSEVAIRTISAATEYGEDTIRNFLPTLYNQAVIRCDNPASVKADVETYFSNKETSNLIFIYDRDTMEAVVTIDEEVSQSLHMLYVFPVIFFFVALLVVMTTVSRLILRERTNIGTMKALGIGNKQIVFHYAFFSTLITALGCIVGAVLGPLIIPRVMGIKYTLMFSMPLLCGTVVSIPFTFLTLFVVSGASALIGIWASRSVIRENPAECMRPRRVTYAPKVREQRSDEGISHVKLSLLMSLRNIRINWKRALLTVIGILGCSALLLTSFGIGDTLNGSLENDFGGHFYYDVWSSYTAAQESAVCDALDEWKQEGKIFASEPVRQYVAMSEGNVVPVWVMQEHSVMTDVLNGGNAISASDAKSLGVVVGDSVVVTIGAKSAKIVVQAVVETSVWNGLFVSDNPFGDDVYCANTVWVKTENPDQIKDELNKINGTVTAQTRTEKVEEIQSLISSTNTMKYTLMIFAVLLSVVVLYNLSLLNLKERMRDMATLKVLGFTRFQIALSLVFEIMLLTCVGTAIGCVCGFPLLYLVMSINEISVMAFMITLKPISYVLSVLISLLTSLLINLVFSSLIRKISMTESLKSIE